MKKLGKLTINPEKVIKNEELVNLRGGYGGGGGSWFECTCTNGFNPVYGGSNPWCEQFSTTQAMLDKIESKCVNGEGSCSAGCNP